MLPFKLQNHNTPGMSICTRSCLIHCIIVHSLHVNCCSLNDINDSFIMCLIPLIYRRISSREVQNCISYYFISKNCISSLGTPFLSRDCSTKSQYCIRSNINTSRFVDVSIILSSILYMTSLRCIRFSSLTRDHTSVWNYRLWYYLHVGTN